MAAVCETVASILPDLPNGFSSLSQLAQAEEEDAKRIRPSRIGWWRDVWRIRGSTISRSWQSCSLFTLWATAVALADLKYGRALSLTNNVTPLLSVVVGLLLVFRNGSAYTRWDDGRKTFAKMTSVVRSLSRTVWINVGAATPTRGRLASDGVLRPTQDEGLSPEDHEDKIKVLRMMVAFVVAAKHHVRREYGMNWPDLDPLLPPKLKQVARTTGFGWNPEADGLNWHQASPGGGQVEGLGSEIQRLWSRTSHTSLLSAEEAGHAHERMNTRGQSTPPLAGPKSFHSGAGYGSERRPLLRKRAKNAEQESSAILNDHMARPSLPLPLIIAHQLSLYFASCKRRNLLESIGPAGYNALIASVNQLVDCFTTCESLAKVGIPTVYGVHLKQCTSLFLFTLPLVLVELMGFSMIPFVTVVCFIFVGIESIATGIEMPFGIDDSDLSLDLFCAELRNEVEHCISRLSTATDEWEL